MSFKCTPEPAPDVKRPFAFSSPPLNTSAQTTANNDMPAWGLIPQSADPQKPKSWIFESQLNDHCANHGIILETLINGFDETFGA